MVGRFHTTCTLLLFSFVLCAGTALAVPIAFNVDALQNSTSGSGVGLDTGVVFAAGDIFTVSVELDDLWSAGDLPRWSNADGLIVALFATGSDDSGETAGTQIGAAFVNHPQHGLLLPFGSLVGSIDGNFFLLGTSFNGAAPASGTLLLHYWDSNNSDNTELITASVDPDPRGVPLPATLPLLGVGLAVYAFRRF